MTEHAPKTNYRQTRIFTPQTAPFDSEFWAETVLGNIIEPAVTDADGLDWFWFSRYKCPPGVDSGDCDITKIPPNFQRPDGNFHSLRFRYSIQIDHQEAFESKIQNLLNARSCHISDFRNYDFLDDLGGERHTGGERTPERQQRRADLVAQFYNATADLVMDALVGPDEEGRFSIEKNDNSQNPLGSSFESLHHLFCNITNVPLRVLVSQIGIGTDWMPIQQSVQGIRVQF
jgi:hypothetical protein